MGRGKVITSKIFTRKGKWMKKKAIKKISLINQAELKRVLVNNGYKNKISKEASALIPDILHKLLLKILNRAYRNKTITGLDLRIEEERFT